MKARLLAAGLMTLGVASAAGSIGLVKASTATYARSQSTGPMGAATTASQPAFLGYYDSHKDTYLSTDVSNKAQAKAMKINYSSTLGSVHGLPSIYLVQGVLAAHQLAVFGSEPGAPDYSPLWQEVQVHWKAAGKPILLTSDNQINALAKKGTVTLTHSPVVLNCPIIKVGK